RVDKVGLQKWAILPSAQALTENAWRALLKYANGGGNLLITRPVNHDEHWHTIPRAAELKLDARTEPLTYHNAPIQWNNRALILSFDQQKQTWLESLLFKDGSTLKDLPYG